MAERTVRIGGDLLKQLEAFAASRGMSLTEAAERILSTGVGRRAALARYAEKKGAPKKARKARKARKAAK